MRLDLLVCPASAAVVLVLVTSSSMTDGFHLKTPTITLHPRRLAITTTASSSHPVSFPAAHDKNRRSFVSMRRRSSLPVFSTINGDLDASSDAHLPRNIPADPSPQPLTAPTTTTSTTPTTSTTTTTTVVGQWEEMHGNYLLRPPNQAEPRALIHFLGGALVGAAPDVAYRYLLERLSHSGFLVVATPFNLSFDYMTTCDDIIHKFERIAPTLARKYGAMPVVGLGHSAGALLHLLITSLFPDTPRAANALLSFNNKPVKEAVPLFEEIFAPLFVAVAAKNETRLYPPSSLDILNLSLRLARSAASGDLPSDELLTDISTLLTPPQLASLLSTPEKITIPPSVRNALSAFMEPTTNALSNAGILTLSDRTVDVLEQIPLLIREVADGARDFDPPPSSVQAAARRAYRARRTLLIEYDNDTLDESPQIESLLRQAEMVMRMKRPMINIDIQRTVISGNHITPLLAPHSLDLANKVEDILGATVAREKLSYDGAVATVVELVRWLEEGRL